MGEKDSTYYEDLKYYISKLALLPLEEDKNRDLIIEQRLEMVEHSSINEFTKKNMVYYTISSFQSDFFKFVVYIGDLVGTCIDNPKDLYKYKELIKQNLDSFIENLNKKEEVYIDDNNKNDLGLSKKINNI